MTASRRHSRRSRAMPSRKRVVRADGVGEAARARVLGDHRGGRLLERLHHPRQAAREIGLGERRGDATPRAECTAEEDEALRGVPTRSTVLVQRLPGPRPLEHEQVVDGAVQPRDGHERLEERLAGDAGVETPLPCEASLPFPVGRPGPLDDAFEPVGGQHEHAVRLRHVAHDHLPVDGLRGVDHAGVEEPADDVARRRGGGALHWQSTARRSTSLRTSSRPPGRIRPRRRASSISSRPYHVS